MTSVCFGCTEFSAYTKKFVERENTTMPMGVCVLRCAPTGYPIRIDERSGPCL